MAVCRVPEMEFATDRTLRPNDVRYPTEKLAPWAGVEPATFRLTVERSTAELPGNAAIVDSGGAITKAYRRCKAAFFAMPPRFARPKRPPSRATLAIAWLADRSAEGAKVGGHARN